MLNLKNIKLREDIEEALSYKEDYENIKKLNQNLSEELNSMKASAIWDSNKISQIVVTGDQEHSKLDNKVARKRKVIEEIKEYLKEILYVYGTLRNLIKERAATIKLKQARISEYGGKIEEIKKLANKDQQLKLIKELKETIPFMSALTLRNDNMKTMFLGIVAEGNAKYSRLAKYADEADKYNDIAKVIKERCLIFEAKLNAYEAATLCCTLNCVIKYPHLLIASTLEFVVLLYHRNAHRRVKPLVTYLHLFDDGLLFAIIKKDFDKIYLRLLLTSNQQILLVLMHGCYFSQFSCYFLCHVRKLAFHQIDASVRNSKENVVVNGIDQCCGFFGVHQAFKGPFQYKGLKESFVDVAVRVSAVSYPVDELLLLVEADCMDAVETSSHSLAIEEFECANVVLQVRLCNFLFVMFGQYSNNSRAFIEEEEISIVIGFDVQYFVPLIYNSLAIPRHLQPLANYSLVRTILIV
eukprot:TRINITY_DN12893_c0_g1_i13.p1 TRINITY_DN12893_c0_g1~~TRINITY_DN12893_c0_g1_i13.p1  ORF type:complete len:468 (-),score=58.60 TRINITY_DN12893_c0_g1_i13:1685-3088(-)